MPVSRMKAGGGMDCSSQYVIEMNHITKEFPGIKANDDITLQLKKGDCFYFYAIQKLMLERLGIPTIDCKKVPNFEGDSNHYWLLVSVDGGENYYHYDNVWSWDLCLVTDAQLDALSATQESKPFNRDTSLYPATPTEKLPAGELPWDDAAIAAARP